MSAFYEGNVFLVSEHDVGDVSVPCALVCCV